MFQTEFFRSLLDLVIVFTLLALGYRAHAQTYTDVTGDYSFVY
jgi:hypothetical protein